MLPSYFLSMNGLSNDSKANDPPAALPDPRSNEGIHDLPERTVIHSA